MIMSLMHWNWQLPGRIARATRDLQDLMDKAALTRAGQLKGTPYHLHRPEPVAL
jgi:hypothetical protein